MFQRTRGEGSPSIIRHILWFGLKWNLIFCIVVLFCLVLFKADRSALGFMAIALFLFFLVFDSFRQRRRMKAWAARLPKK